MRTSKSSVLAQPGWNFGGLLEETWPPDEFTKEPTIRRNGKFQYHRADYRRDLKTWDWNRELEFAVGKWRGSE